MDSEVKVHVNILGAGLCGSLLAIMLAKRGYPVTIREMLLRDSPTRNPTAWPMITGGTKPVRD